MSSPARLASVTRVTLHGQGDTPAPTPTGFPETKACQRRWAAQMKVDAEKRWSQCDTAMAADHVRALAADLKGACGTDATTKALTSLGCTLFGDPAFQTQTFSAQWTGTPAQVQMSIRGEASQPKEAGVAFGLEVPAGSTEPEVRSALRTLAQAPAEPRRTFDPVTELPAADVQALLGHIETAVPNASDFDVLFGAAAVLMAWADAERSNASELTLRLGGVTEDEQEIRPGQDMVFEVRGTGLAPAAAPAAEAVAGERVTVRLRR